MTTQPAQPSAARQSQVPFIIGNFVIGFFSVLCLILHLFGLFGNYPRDVILFRSIDHRIIGPVLAVFQIALLAAALALIWVGGEGVVALYICIGAAVIQGAALVLNSAASSRRGAPDLTHGWLNLRRARGSNSDANFRIEVLEAVARQGRRLSERAGDLSIEEMRRIRRGMGEPIAGGKRTHEIAFEGRR